MHCADCANAGIPLIGDIVCDAKAADHDPLPNFVAKLDVIAVITPTAADQRAPRRCDFPWGDMQIAGHRDDAMDELQWYSLARLTPHLPGGLASGIPPREPPIA